MSEEEAFLEKAARYLASAALLLDAGDFDSSVSRAYYAMFYAAEAALLSKGLSRSTHKGVISAFGEEFVKTGVFPATMGRNLSAAFQKRQVGDYGATPLVGRDDAQLVLDHARAFVEAVRKQIVRP